MQLPASAERVRLNTAQSANRRIQEDTLASVVYHSRHPDEIDRRLQELDEEWDTERVLQTNAAGLALAGTLLGIFADRRFLLLPTVVGAFLLQHGVQGWCPPLPLIRRLGVRTPREIEAERYALKAVRGDFIGAPYDGPRAAARVTGRI